MVDDDEGESLRIKLHEPRKLSWRMVALVAVDTAEDLFLTTAAGFGHLRCVLAADMTWREGNDRFLAQIEALPTVGDADR